MHRVWYQLHTKAVDGDQRVISGIATNAEPDRVGDIVEPKGVKFQNPMPLLLHHRHDLPVGTATFGRPTPEGIPFTASFPDIPEAGSLKDRVTEAWHSVKAGLIRAVSIGFRANAEDMELLKSGGWRFLKSEVLELSLVTIPANAGAVITSIKSFDAPYLAATGNGQGPEPKKTPGASGTPVVRLLPTRQEQIMKTLAEQIAAFKSTRDAKYNELNTLVTKSGEAGETPNAADSESCDTLEAEVSTLDKHIKRLEGVQELQKSAAVTVNGADPLAASAVRGGQAPIASVRVTSNEEPGIGFARAVLCKTASFLSQGTYSPLDFAKAKYPDNDRLQTYLKATIPGGTTTGVTWAAPFMDPTNLSNEFIDFLRPMTIIGKLGPRLRQVPFNVRILTQSSGGDSYWVGEGAPKPVTKFDFAAITHLYHKVASITVITEELARFSSPSAERIVRDSLAQAQTARVDIDLLDPTTSAVSGVNPASLTYGVTPRTPSGVTSDSARADIAGLIKAYLDDNQNVSSLVLVMPASLALSLSVMVNSLGQAEFPGISMDGGTLMGIPVITSQYVANQSGAGNLVVAVNAQDILLSDDGQVTVDASREASIQMLDNPTTSSATGTATTSVSMWQTNSIALRAERYITWSKARSTAVKFIDDVNWGSIGSPA